MNISLSKTKAFWLEYADEELSDERATTIYENTLAFVKQVLKMQAELDMQDKKNTEVRRDEKPLEYREKRKFDKREKDKTEKF